MSPINNFCTKRFFHIMVIMVFRQSKSTSSDVENVTVNIHC